MPSDVPTSTPQLDRSETRASKRGPYESTGTSPTATYSASKMPENVPDTPDTSSAKSAKKTDRSSRISVDVLLARVKHDADHRRAGRDRPDVAQVRLGRRHRVGIQRDLLDVRVVVRGRH